MRIRFHVLLLFISLFSLTTLNSCGSSRPTGPAGNKVNYDNWLVGGQIANDGYAGGEVLALALDGMRYRSRVDENQSFGIQLPGNGSYALYFLSAAERQADVNAREDNLAGIATPLHAVGTEALLNFEESPDIGMRDTLRLPKVLFQNTVNLGQVDIKDGKAFPTVNPSQSLDFDNDGINDFADTDDQNDGLADREQQQNNEQIEICHFNDRDEGKTVNVSLSDLYNHVEDGDTLGPCIASQRPPRNTLVSSANSAPKNPNLTPPKPVVTSPVPPAQLPSAGGPPAFPPVPHEERDEDADDKAEGKNEDDEEGRDEDTEEEGDEKNERGKKKPRRGGEASEDEDDSRDDEKDPEDKDDAEKKQPSKKKRPAGKSERKHLRLKLRVS